MSRTPISIIPLLLANLLPVAGVIYLGWSLMALLTLYWMENLIVGLMNVLKIGFSIAPLNSRLKIIAVFIFHYGVFWIMHGLFMMVFVFPIVHKSAEIGGRALNTSIDISLSWALAGLFVSHFFSFFFNFMLRIRILEIPPEFFMFTPYGRVIVLHVLIIGGAFLAEKWGGSLTILIMFVTLKIIADIFSHITINNLYERGPNQRRMFTH